MYIIFKNTRHISAESHAQRTLRQMELRFEKYDLVICDEFGYISFDKEGAELLFNLFWVNSPPLAANRIDSRIPRPLAAG